MPSILCSNARAPVAQLVRASDWNSVDLGSNPGWISMSLFFYSWMLDLHYICIVYIKLHIMPNLYHWMGIYRFLHVINTTSNSCFYILQDKSRWWRSSTRFQFKLERKKQQECEFSPGLPHLQFFLYKNTHTRIQTDSLVPRRLGRG